MNKKGLIFNGILAGLSLLYIGLCFVPMFQGSSLLDLAKAYMSATEGFLVVLEKVNGYVIIASLIISALTFAFAVVLLLTSVNVIKGTTLAMIARILMKFVTNFAMGCAVFIGVIFYMDKVYAGLLFSVILLSLRVVMFLEARLVKYAPKAAKVAADEPKTEPTKENTDNSEK